MSGWDAYVAALMGDKSVITGAAIYGQSGQQITDNTPIRDSWWIRLD